MKKATRKAAFAAAIEIRREATAADGRWFEVLALGWDGSYALLAVFRRRGDAEACKSRVMTALRNAVKNAHR